MRYSSHAEDTFQYLRSMLQNDEGIKKDISHKIKVRWVKWRPTFNILCDEKVSIKIKGKLYRTAIRSTMMYDVQY
jgi:hypothetical protein